MTSRSSRLTGLLLAAAGVGFAMMIALSPAHAQRIADIRGTKHNFAASNSGAAGYSYSYQRFDDLGVQYGGTTSNNNRRVLAASETQVCVFCHTPHGATVKSSEGTPIPLWNRKLSDQVYTTYRSNSLDALNVGGGMTQLDQPSGSSKLCLSCHDGTLAVNTVNVLSGQTGVAQAGVTVDFKVISGAVTTNFSNAATYKLGQLGTNDPAGNQFTGNTRVIGIDLSNDHPISITYNSAVAVRDGELRDLDSLQRYPKNSATPIVGRKILGQPKPKLPLEMTGVGYRSNSSFSGTVDSGQIQCATCHDPHIRAVAGPDAGYEKFLRLNRFQAGHPATSAATYSLTLPQDYNQSADVICLACHDKNLGSAQTFLYSAHADPRVADETYNAAGAAERDFPPNLQVWQASCLNCHDSHTVAGSRRLLREGIVGGGPGVYPKVQGSQAFATDRKPAIEETCYQCHNDFSGSGVGGSSGYRAINFSVSNGFAQVPQIRYEFVTRSTGSNARMPITVYKLSGATSNVDVEVHDIGFGNAADCELGTYTATNYSNAQTKCGADFVETQALLKNRHVECTDCHNPHRILRTRCFNGVKNDPACNGGTGEEYKVPDVWGTCYAQGNCTAATQQDPGTHNHVDNATISGGALMKHTNIISGVLRGAYGVQPIYNGGLSQNSFYNPNSNIQFRVLRGDPPTGWSFPATSVPFNGDATEVIDNTLANENIYVTREYQICLKCHSNFGATTGAKITDLEILNIATASGTNGLTNYTNQAREFRAPKSHQGEGITKGVDGGARYDTNNHRSWHPVMGKTGRDAAARGGLSANNWLGPWRNDLGNQTMYCSDCHGSDLSASSASVFPNGGGAGKPRIWGPHGSANPFILKAPWKPNDGVGGGTGAGRSDDLCFRCHSYNIYGANTTGTRTGFFFNTGSSSNNDGHWFHYNQRQIQMRCTFCHVAVPHGWKNKALLANLNDVGSEVVGGSDPGKEVCTGTNGWGTGKPAGYGGTCGNGGTTGRGYDGPPYYMGAVLKVLTFGRSGQWQEGYCGSASGTSGKTWMQAACDKGAN